jgi:hypothetical protein
MKAFINEREGAGRQTTAGVSVSRTVENGRTVYNAAVMSVNAVMAMSIAELRTRGRSRAGLYISPAMKPSFAKGDAVSRGALMRSRRADGDSQTPTHRKPTTLQGPQ